VYWLHSQAVTFSDFPIFISHPVSIEFLFYCNILISISACLCAFHRTFSLDILGSYSYTKAPVAWHVSLVLCWGHCLLIVKESRSLFTSTGTGYPIFYTVIFSIFHIYCYTPYSTKLKNCYLIHRCYFISHLSSWHECGLSTIRHLADSLEVDLFRGHSRMMLIL
jgi:hypothetical protein